MKKERRNMEIQKTKSIIEAILFSAGRIVTEDELVLALEIDKNQIEEIIRSMQEDYKTRGIQIIKVENGYQMCSKKEYYEYIYPILDKRTKPSLSTAALETLAIIAYNPRATRAEIEAIRGVNSDGTIYKLLDYGLIEDAGKADLPGKPTTYKTTPEFLKMFGYESLAKLPELPKYKLDSNRQIVIDELVETKEERIK
jgi:segregation and condensation protein B